jgi:hypothetical protein
MMKKSRTIVLDLKAEHDEYETIRRQASRCVDHPDAFVSVEFRVTRSWRGWVCTCDECGELVDEFDE